MVISINTGVDARSEDATEITNADFGVRYSGFRSLDRFEEQIDGLNAGYVSWPGGSLAEADVNGFGFQFDGLMNPALGRPGLSEMMEFANTHQMDLSVVLPTARYCDDIDQMRADVRDFMQDLLSGHYGPLPENLIFHIGSEHYHHFQGLSPDGAAADYGQVASAMVEEISAALDDARLNPTGVDVQLSVQAGRTPAEDADIRESFSEDALSRVDMVMHHRYASRAEGIDFNLRDFDPILDAWRADVEQAGGETPGIHLSEWGVASVTRSEAMTRYIRDMAEQGVTVHRSELDEAGRTNEGFERYWQELLSTRDYGADVPRLYLELFSEYQAEGVGAASIHAVDMMHAGRITHTDASGNPVQFVGADMMEMLYESVGGTTVLDVSEQNSRSDDIWTYAYESESKLVVFLASDTDQPAGEVSVDIEGLRSGYTAIWTDSLSAEVPDDWMARFGITDNPEVDESNEGQTYAMGVRGDAPFTVSGNTMTFRMEHPGEVVRIIVAHTPEEAASIAEWAGPPDMYLEGAQAPDADPDDDPISITDPVAPHVPDGPTGSGSTSYPADLPSLFSLRSLLNARQPVPSDGGTQPHPTQPAEAPGSAPLQNSPFGGNGFFGSQSFMSGSFRGLLDGLNSTQTTPHTGPTTTPASQSPAPVTGTDSAPSAQPGGFSWFSSLFGQGGNAGLNPMAFLSQGSSHGAANPATPAQTASSHGTNPGHDGHATHLDFGFGLGRMPGLTDDDATQDTEADQNTSGGSWHQDIALMLEATTGAVVTGLLLALGNGLS